jgi:Carboxypeptidase regulatory-like domain
MRRLMVSWIGLLLVASSAVSTTGNGRGVTVVSGTVRDQGGSPLQGVSLHVKGANLSDIATDSDGWFRLAIVDVPGEIPLRFSRTGFEDKVLAVQPQAAEIKLDVVLKRKSLAVSLTEFERGRWIRGKVSGLASGEEAKLKVLVYVLTNKWYIHPEAVATPGLGFAVIDPAGRWEIASVWRGFQATKLAVLVVPKDAWAPPTVEPGEVRPEDTLCSRLVPLAFSILEAPAGI